MGKIRSQIDLAGIHLLTYKQVYNYRLNQAKSIVYGLRKEHYARIRMTPAKLIRQAHIKAVLFALERNEEISMAVLLEYRFYKGVAPAVKQYLRKRKLKLE